MASSKAEVRDRFSLQIEQLTTMLKSQGESLQGSGQPKQFEPDRNGWGGDPFDLEGIEKPFDRAEHKEDVEAAIADLADPGTVGDLVASSLQGDILAVLERSFRASNMSRVRRTVHAAARRAGHGNDAGPWKRGIKGVIEGILKHSKDGQVE